MKSQSNRLSLLILSACTLCQALTLHAGILPPVSLLEKMTNRVFYFQSLLTGIVHRLAFHRPGAEQFLPYRLEPPKVLSPSHKADASGRFWAYGGAGFTWLRGLPQSTVYDAATAQMQVFKGILLNGQQIFQYHESVRITAGISMGSLDSGPSSMSYFYSPFPLALIGLLDDTPHLQALENAGAASTSVFLPQTGSITELTYSSHQDAEPYDHGQILAPYHHTFYSGMFPPVVRWASHNRSKDGKSSTLSAHGMRPQYSITFMLDGSRRLIMIVEISSGYVDVLTRNGTGWGSIRTWDYLDDDPDGDSPPTAMVQ